MMDPLSAVTHVADVTARRSASVLRRIAAHANDQAHDAGPCSPASETQAATAQRTKWSDPQRTDASSRPALATRRIRRDHTTGRKTGKQRRKCVRVIRRGDRAYLVQLVPPQIALTRPGAVSSWLLNIKANPRVLLRINGGSFQGIAREITDPAELELARSVLCDNVYPTDYAEAGLHLRGLPRRAKIKELHEYWFDTGHPLVVEFDG